jgi:23S rRNA (adenine2030-N6)-methyltransferase
VDTRAGAGIYSLEDGFAAVSKEAAGGIFRLQEFVEAGNTVPKSLQQYLDCISSGNPQGEIQIYRIAVYFLRAFSDRKIVSNYFELHPKEIDILRQNISPT